VPGIVAQLALVAGTEGWIDGDAFAWHVTAPTVGSGAGTTLQTLEPE
jgi:cystathionine beta-lyase family protein involved in aluminum resistance